MQGRWWGFLLIAVFVSTNYPCFADEYVGKLKRVDRKTITLVGDNKKIVLEVDSNVRKLAAPYLGKSVSVSFQFQSGKNKAVSLRLPANQ